MIKYVPQQGEVVYPVQGSKFYTLVKNRDGDDTTKLYKKEGRPWVVISSTRMNHTMSKCWVVPMGTLHDSKTANRIWFVDDDEDKTLREIFASEIITVDNHELSSGHRKINSHYIEAVVQKIMFNLGLADTKVDFIKPSVPEHYPLGIKEEEKSTKSEPVKVEADACTHVRNGKPCFSFMNSTNNMVVCSLCKKEFELNEETTNSIMKLLCKDQREKLVKEIRRPEAEPEKKKNYVRIDPSAVMKSLLEGECKTVDDLVNKFGFSKHTAQIRWREYLQVRLKAEQKAKAQGSTKILNPEAKIPNNEVLDIRKVEYKGTKPALSVPAMLQVPKNHRNTVKYAYQWMYHFKYDTCHEFAKAFPGSPKAVQQKYYEVKELLDVYNISAP